MAHNHNEHSQTTGNNPDINKTNTRIYQAAIASIKRGFSVIPTSTDKQPRNFIQWKMFQQQAPDEKIINHWYDEKLFSDGYAIITGQVSKRLLVIDTDDYALAETFITHFPELAKTYRVATRRGIHFYFYANTDYEPRSQKLPSLDIQWNGRYVVAPPTPNYSILEKTQILPLSKADYNHILRLFAKPETQLDSNHTPDSLTHILSLQEIISVYRRMAEQGRNNALFEAGKLARDYGYMPNELITAGLQDVFVNDRFRDGKEERIESRLREYTRTIASVYSRKPRELNRDSEIVRLTDDARERLHQNGQSAEARVLDAIFLKFGANIRATRKEIYEAFAGVIDWKLIDRTLKATFNGKILFRRAPLSPAPPNPEGKLEKRPLKNAISGVKKTEKIKSGRKPVVFIMPTAELIQRITGAQKRASTPVTMDDLASPRNYRIRLTVGRIARTQHYRFHAKSWLANTVNTTERTITSYLKSAKLYKVERYQAIRSITWQSIGALEAVELSPMYFLTDQFGRKYPAKQAVAARLLNTGRSLTLRKQGANYYSTKTIDDSTAQSKTFSRDMADLMSRYDAKQSLGGITKREIANPALEQFKEKYWQEMRAKHDTTVADEQPEAFPVPPEYDEKGESLDLLRRWGLYMDAIYNALSVETYQGIEGISEPSEKALYRRAYREADEDAKTLTMLMPPLEDGNRTLSHEKAKELIVNYGAQRCHQEAMKITIEYKLEQDSECAIKNPVGVLIYRLNLDNAQGADKTRKPETTKQFRTGHSNAGAFDTGAYAGAFDTGEKF